MTRRPTFALLFAIVLVPPVLHAQETEGVFELQGSDDGRAVRVRVSIRGSGKRVRVTRQVGQGRPLQGDGRWSGSTLQVRFRTKRGLAGWLQRRGDRSRAQARYTLSGDRLQGTVQIDGQTSRESGRRVRKAEEAEGGESSAPSPSPPAAERPAPRTLPDPGALGEPAADAAPAEEAGAANRGWQRWHRGIDQGAGSIPRSGQRNPTLQRTLGVAREPFGTRRTYGGREFVAGTGSWFGGPTDRGVDEEETGALTGERLRSLNDPRNPDPAVARRRARDYYFAAMRYDYTPGAAFWRNARLLVVNPANGRAVVLRNVDWGPNTNTGRIVDISPQAMSDLGATTDETLLVSFAAADAPLGPVE